MEREELLQLVNESIEADGKKLSPSISEETVNGELDDALEDVTEDEESNKKLAARVAKRLLRMDGNIHSNVSREVKEYKKKAGAPVDGKGKKSEKEGTTEDEMPDYVKSIIERLDAMETSRKQKEETDAKSAAESAVKKGLRAKFKDANIDVNEYIYRQTLRDLEIPELEEGESVDTDALVRKMERAYYRNLKEAGLDKKDTGSSRFGNHGGGSGEIAADRFFAKKGKKEGWKK